MITPHTYVLLSGSANGKTPLNAFDQALIDLDIADFNYITVSSILPKECSKGDIQDIKKIELGSFVYCVMSRIYSEKPKDRISSAIACVQTKETVGCITEYSGHCSKKEAERQALKRAEIMVEQRKDATINNIDITSSTLVVEQCGCSVSLCLLLY